MNSSVVPLLGLMASSIAICGAAVSYSTPGGAVSEDFNLPSGTANQFVNNSTYLGWYAVSRQGAALLFVGNEGAGPPSYIPNNGGTPAVGSLINAGATGSSDRALGTQSHNTGDSIISYGLQLSNTSGVSLNSFTLGYTAEQWRVISGEGADGLTVEYQIFSGTGDLSSGTWTPISALNFVAPKTAGTSAPLDGNATGNFSQLSATVNGVAWNPGTELWLRWSDASAGTATKRAILAIDDVTFSAIPEPTSLGLLAIGAMGFLRRRR